MTRPSWIPALALLPFLGCGGTVSTAGDSHTDTGIDGATDTPVDLQNEDVMPQCGDERSSTFPIVNGSTTWDRDVVDLNEGQALAVGALMQLSGGSWSNMCTATLVAPSLVLTAAHCVRGWSGDQPASSFRFAVGDDVSSPTHMWQPTVVQSNPGYSGGWDSSAEWDVAVLVLDEPAMTAVPTIEPIPMNCSPLEEDTFLNEDVQNVGYGITETGWTAPDNSVKWWTVEEVVNLSTFDFTVDGHGVSSVCNGDSGGPSLWTMPDGVIRVVGTVSWGAPDCVSEDHFARVDYNCTFLTGFLEGCGEVTAQGYCDADEAVWCESGSLTRVDCAASGRICGDDGTGAMRCLDVPEPCGDITEVGICEATTAIWCELDELVSRDCAAEGLECGDDGTGHMRCIELDACATLGWEGECVGSDAYWCEDGEIRIRNCADCAQECGWVDSMGAYYCIDPA